MSKDIKNKVMVITGASSGIGRATALEFAKQGGNVVLAARDEEALEELADFCKSLGGKAHYVPTDTSREEDMNALAQEAYSKFGKIDTWVNNAAVTIFGHFDEIPTDDFKQVLDTNLLGYVYGARAAVRQFRKQGYGTLINVSSMVGIIGQPYSLPYSISKFGIRGLSISLDQELENEKDIHVCSVLPAVIDTPIFNQASNYIGKAITPPSKAIPAEKVAHKIISLALKPEKEVLVGASALQMRIMRLLAPGVFDKKFRKMIWQNHFDEQPVSSTTGNLYAPMEQHTSTSGGWLSQQKKDQKPLKLAGQLALLAGTAIGIGLWIQR